MQNDRPLILIVDDETKIRRLVARNLEDFGYDVVPAADGVKALAYCEEKTSELRPDLILMDVMMPGMDGFECAEKIRRLSDVPIIFLSARSERAYKMQGFDVGADDYVTKPFSFEGKRKMGLAEQGIANLLMHVDSLIVIPNERLKMISQEKITLMNAFQAADNVLRQGVESISALINVPAFINLDFADVRSIMKDAGYAHMGVGSAKGAGKAENAAKAAISSPLLETSIAGAHGVIINITSSPDIGLEDVETAAGLITQSAHPDANIIWGTAFDENLSDEMRVTVVATGFDNKSASDLRNSINNAMGGAQSVPSAVFSSDTGASAAPASNAAPAAAPAEKKAVEEESSDNRYYDELLAILNKRK